MNECVRYYYRQYYYSYLKVGKKGQSDEVDARSLSEGARKDEETAKMYYKYLGLKRNEAQSSG